MDLRKKILGEQHPKTVKAVALLAEIRSEIVEELNKRKKVSLIYSRVQLIHIFMILVHHLSKIASWFSKILKKEV